jgi:hypothetical protein
MSITPRRPAQKSETILREMVLIATRLEQLDRQTNGFQHARLDKCSRHLAAAAEELTMATGQFRMLGRRMVEGITFDQWFEAAGEPDNVPSKVLVDLFQAGVDPADVRERAKRLKESGM